MSRDMKRKFNFVNIAAGELVDITNETILAPYNKNTGAA